ncbi:MULTISPECIES: DUF3891 family protein [Bacillaceae]|uniref:DUF3891 family protein n=1 Tax=Bacillaceae TaxID=186817 RepID=UPI001E35F375|nr:MULTISPECIES: DUF3891 family protein [Bacillaceae]
MRDHSDRYILIEQDNHAHISGKLAANWQEALFQGDRVRKAVEFAIYHHDLGWRLLDKQPFWNDKSNRPYTFLDFPELPKTVFYKHGIDEVEQNDTYAGLLCSRHYTRFLENSTLEEARLFVQHEKRRQQRIKQSLPAFDQASFDFHYGLLQFCDNVSLYICLNEPGAAKEQEHPFFKDGIPIPDSFAFLKQKKAEVAWMNDQTIMMDVFPFNGSVDVMLKQKTVTKESILEKGVIESYQNAPLQQTTIMIEAKEGYITN